MTAPPSGNPLLSVLVPTYDRPDLVRQLLRCLSAQTLAAERFELVLVDDGSPTVVEVDEGLYPFAITLIRQANAGPAAARNAGIELCQAPLTLILNDDSVPAEDLLERHLEIHAGLTGKVAVLGTFTFNESSLKSPFTQVLADSDLLFNYPVLEHDNYFNWSTFWTCNLSIKTEALIAVGGFDEELFDKAIVEDVELGYRLQKVGYRVLYREDARCEHDHALTPSGFYKRGVWLGRYLARMYKKHDDPSVLWCAPGKDFDAEQRQVLQTTFEAYYGASQRLLGSLESLDQAQWGERLDTDNRAQIEGLVRSLFYVPFSRGVLMELYDHDPERVMIAGPPQGELTSIVVVSYNAIDQTRRCLEALRSATEAVHPSELIFVDNGSTDGTAQYLAEQDDVHLIRNSANLGAPAARNQGIAASRGEQLVFMDNDVMVTPGWLGRMLFHGAIDKYSGCVSCLSDRAAHGQQIEYAGGDSSAALQVFADSRAEQHERQFRPQAFLTSFLLMVRREVIETIGGFDECFSPWGFEDDDFSLRSHLAGFNNRIALDVFVRHEDYQGVAKSKTHGSLLNRNWTRFADKWSLPVGTEYGDISGLKDLVPGARTKEQLHLPVEGQGEKGKHVLAWPDYRDAKALGELLKAVADDSSAGPERQLLLRVLPGIDGPVDEVLKVVDIVRATALGPTSKLKVGFLEEKNPKLATDRALQLCSSADTTGGRKRSIKWLRKTGLPLTSNES